MILHSLDGFLISRLKKLLIQVHAQTRIQPKLLHGAGPKSTKSEPSSLSERTQLEGDMCPRAGAWPATTHKSRGVVVLHSLGIPKGLQDGVGL